MGIARPISDLGGPRSVDYLKSHGFQPHGYSDLGVSSRRQAQYTNTLDSKISQNSKSSKGSKISKKEKLKEERKYSHEPNPQSGDKINSRIQMYKQHVPVSSYSPEDTKSDKRKKSPSQESKVESKSTKDKEFTDEIKKATEKRLSSISTKHEEQPIKENSTNVKQFYFGMDMVQNEQSSKKKESKASANGDVEYRKVNKNRSRSQERIIDEPYQERPVDVGDL